MLALHVIVTPGGHGKGAAAEPAPPTCADHAQPCAEETCNGRKGVETKPAWSGQAPCHLGFAFSLIPWRKRPSQCAVQPLGPPPAGQTPESLSPVPAASGPCLLLTNTLLIRGCEE